MQKYKSIDSGEIVFIAEESGNLYTLSDGVKIMKTFFDKKYIPATATNEIDPHSFLNTPATAGYQKLIENQENLMKIKQDMNPAADPNYVDPDAFFNSGGFDMNTITDAMKAVNNSNATRPAPPSQTEATVRELSAAELNDLPGMDSFQKEKYLREHIPVAHRLSDSELAKYREVDEDDPNLLKQFEQHPELKKTNNKEILKRQHEEFLRQHAEETGVVIEDPALQKYEEKHKAQVVQENIPQQIMEYNKPTQRTQEEDDDYRFFKRFKRNYPVKIKLEIDDKITKPSTIADIMESYEGDFIAHYAKEILTKILSDVAGLEKRIYDQIQEIVYPDGINNEEEIIEEPRIEMIRDTSTQPLTMLNEVVEHVDVDPEIKTENVSDVATEELSMSSAYGENPETGEKVYDWQEWQKISQKMENK